MSKHSAIIKKRDEIQRSIELEQEAKKKDIESDKTLMYYRSELKRHQERNDANLQALDDRFESTRKTLEEKNDAAKRALDDKLEAAIKALEEKNEAAKRALDDKLDTTKRSLEDKHLAVKKDSDTSFTSEKRRLEDLISGKIEKLEESEPDTQLYRKKKAERKKLDTEEQTANDEVIDAFHKWQEAENKKINAAMNDAKFKERQIHLKQQQEEEKAREEYALRVEQETIANQKKFDEALARAGTRIVKTSTEPVDHVKEALESLETAIPQKKLRVTRKGKKLNIEELKKGQVYHIEDLETIDINTLTDEQIELYDDLWTSACKLDGFVGCKKVDK